MYNNSLNTVSQLGNITPTIDVTLPNDGYSNLFQSIGNWFTGNVDWRRQQIMHQQQVALSNSAYQRAVDDMKKAGLNPALMYGSGSSAVTPSSPSQPNSAYGFAPVVSLVNNALNLAHKSHDNSNSQFNQFIRLVKLLR